MIRGFHDEMDGAGIGGMASTSFRLIAGGIFRTETRLLTSKHCVNNISEPLMIYRERARDQSAAKHLLQTDWH
jgi:hypothetical protein